MTGLDTSQNLTDQAVLGTEKLRSHPHLEGHPHAGEDSAEPAQPAQDDEGGDVEAAAAHP